MKDRFLKIWSLTMVLVIAASTSGMSINRHYCGGKEKSKAFILEADKCDFESKPICIKHETNTVSKKACCSDQSEYYIQILQIDIDHSPVMPDFIVAAITSVNHLSFQLYSDQSADLTPVYRPPPQNQELFLVHQSFLL